MKHLFGLAMRRYRIALRAHLASVMIAVAVMMAWLLFWGYMDYTSIKISGRVVNTGVAADLVVTAPFGEQVSIPDRYAQRLAVYRNFEAETPLGLQSVAAVSFVDSTRSPLPLAQPGEVWLPESLRGWGNIKQGDQFKLSLVDDFRYSSVQGIVAGYYPAPSDYPAIVVSNDWMQSSGLVLRSDVTNLYQSMPDFGRWNRRLPPGAVLTLGAHQATQAMSLVGTTYSEGGFGVALLFLFFLLGVGTYALLTYMDSRRELALLKSMGLKPRELSGLFVLECLFTAVLSFGLTLCLAVYVDQATALPFELAPWMAPRLLVLALVAFAGATATPYIMAQKASVNELLLNRPVPLAREQITGLRRRYPALDSLLQQGLQLVKLPTIDGVMNGICFCREGDRVKQGETVAWESFAWGLREREYLAPCAGQVVRLDVAQGLLVIKPNVTQ